MLLPRLLLAAFSLFLTVSCNSQQKRLTSYKGLSFTGATEYYNPGMAPRSARSVQPSSPAPAKPRRASWLARVSNSSPDVRSADKPARSARPSRFTGSTAPPSFANPDGTISRVEGNAMINPDGSQSWLVGNTVFHSNGTRSRIVGDTLINADGSKSPRIGKQ